MSEFDLAVQWIIAVGVMAILLLRGHFSPFHATSFYWLFHVIVFCIRPSLIHYLDFDFAWTYMRFTPAPEHLQTTLLLSSFGLVVFSFVYSFTCQYPKPQAFSMPRAFSIEERRAFYLMLLLLTPLGFYSIFAADVSGERIGGVYIMTGTSGYVNDLQQVFCTMTILFVWFSRWRWYSYIPLLAFIFFRLNQGWARWTIIIPLIALILLYLWDKRRSLPPLKFLLPLPIVFVVFLNLSHDRMYFRKLVEGQEPTATTIQDSQTDLRERFDGLDFSNFDFLTYIVAKVPKETRMYTYGVQHLQLFTEPIPRKLWAGKPIGAPIRTFDLNAYGNFNGLTPSLIGDGWMTGGWIGVTINMALSGFFLARLYNWFIRNQSDIFKVSLTIVITSVLIQLYRDGSIVSMSKFLLFTTLPVFTWLFFTRFLESLEARHEERVKGSLIDEKANA